MPPVHISVCAHVDDENVIRGARDGSAAEGFLVREYTHLLGEVKNAVICSEVQVAIEASEVENIVPSETSCARLNATIQKDAGLVAY